MPKRVTLKEYALAIGIPYGTVKRWAFEGLPVTRRKRAFKGAPSLFVDPAEGDAWRAKKQANRHASLIAFGGQRRMHRVYVARESSTHRVKIGWSNSPERRVKELRKTDAGSHLASLVAVIPDAAKPVELALHELFSPWQHEGEWFEDCEPLNDWLGGLPNAS